MSLNDQVRDYISTEAKKTNIGMQYAFDGELPDTVDLGDQIQYLVTMNQALTHLVADLATAIDELDERTR